MLGALPHLAQDAECPEPKKKAVKLLDLAKHTPKKRYELLLEATQLDPNCLEAYDELSRINEKRAQNAQNPRAGKMYVNKGIEYMHKIIAICPAYRNYYAPLKMGSYYYGNRKYLQAKPFYQTILDAESAYKKDKELAQKRMDDIITYENLLKDSVPFKPQKVNGPSTGNDEYLPMLSPDNKYLFFTRKVPNESKTAFDSGEKELFIQSRKTGDNVFSKGIPMPKPFNLGQFQGGVSVSVNNKLLFITIVEVIPYRGKNRLGYGRMFDNADIFYSELVDGEWTKLASIGSHINTPTTWEAQPSITSDNKTLYFTRVVDPFGGDMDIYKCERQADGSWGEPINVGPPINTLGDEKSPFMHSDSYTLYFSSTGHIGLGGYDIFYAKINPETQTFLPPTNIGYPINTTKDEHGFIVSREGDKAFYGASTDSKNLDLFTFELYEEARPQKVVFVTGEITDQKGEVPEDAKVTLKNTKTQREVEAVVDKNTGGYVAVMTVDRKKPEDLIVTTKKKGHVFSSQLIAANQIEEGKTIEAKKTALQPIEVGKAYAINDIKFATNSYQITPKIKLVLDEFIDFLKTNPTVKTAIHGHTDNVGDPKENLILSENRAKEVYSYLIEGTVDSERISYKGFGETKPKVPNTSEANRAQNRRTEFVILEK